MNSIIFTIGKEYQLKEEIKIKLSIKIKIEKNIVLGPICLKKSGILVISPWYAWDGPSGPTKYISRFLRPIPLIGMWLWWLFIRSFIRGSAVHDALYKLIRHGLLDPSLRNWADIELIKICKEDRMSKVRMAIVKRGLKEGGGSSIRLENKQKEYRAPL